MMRDLTAFYFWVLHLLLGKSRLADNTPIIKEDGKGTVNQIGDSCESTSLQRQSDR